MATCPHCSSYVDDGFAKCGSCGRLLVERSAGTTTTTGSRGEWGELAGDAGNVGIVLSFIAWVSLVLGVLAAFFLLVNEKYLGAVGALIYAAGTWSVTMLGSVLARYVALRAEERRG